jgi:AcrR family transcriptional regulator
MTTSRHSRTDVVEAAGRLFAERGYHGTSMRDLGKALGLHGSSLYSHVDSKEALLVDVVRRGAELFQDAADEAVSRTDNPLERLKALVAGHVGVILDHLDEARTFLNEARALDAAYRAEVVAARDRYEAVFRAAIADGVESGDLRPDVDPRSAGIFVLSILNSIDRWYRPNGAFDPEQLTRVVMEFVLGGIGAQSSNFAR